MQERFREDTDQLKAAVVQIFAIQAIVTAVIDELDVNFTVYIAYLLGGILGHGNGVIRGILVQADIFSPLVGYIQITFRIGGIGQGETLGDTLVVQQHNDSDIRLFCGPSNMEVFCIL